MNSIKYLEKITFFCNYFNQKQNLIHHKDIASLAGLLLPLLAVNVTGTRGGNGGPSMLPYSGSACGG